MNIQNDTLIKIHEAGYRIITFYDPYVNECPKNEATEMQVSTWEPYYKSYTIKATKKETTLSYVLNHIAKKENYQAINWNEVFRPLNLNNVGFYTTSYGIGVEVIFGNRKETISKIELFLDSKDIEYTNEFSEARWVYRFKISKAESNINKIAKL